MMERWPRLYRAWQDRVQARPTREGVWFLILLIGVVAAAVNTGNNLLYIVLASLLALLAISNALAEWNLRGLRVRRHLPHEAFAGEDAAGTIIVENRRRWGHSWAVQVSDHTGEAGDPVARGGVISVPPGGEAAAPVRWRFAARGPVGLARVRVESAHPFGLMRRFRDVRLPASLLVYPTPRPGAPRRRRAGTGALRSHPRLQGQEGELRNLRDYVPGDPLRTVHWPTSARAGRPVVVVRGAQVADEVVVDVKEVSGDAWEGELSRATGQILRHFGGGSAVGLRMMGQTWKARTGDPWRRHLLGLLAGAPRRNGEG